MGNDTFNITFNPSELLTVILALEADLEVKKKEIERWDARNADRSLSRTIATAIRIHDKQLELDEKLRSIYFEDGKLLFGVSEEAEAADEWAPPRTYEEYIADIDEFAKNE